MLRKITESLFCPTIVDSDGKVVRAIWVGDDDNSILINPTTNRVYAALWDDGYEKIYPTLFVSPFALRRVYAEELVSTFSIRTFPYLAVELLRFKHYKMSAVQHVIETFLRNVGII